MVTIHVSIIVKKNAIEEFIKATLENVNQSKKEPGMVQFDLYQQTEDPSCFLLVENYKSQDDVNHHKETLHYKVWREAVMRMMEEPRKSTHYKLISILSENDDSKQEKMEKLSPHFTKKDAPRTFGPE